MFSCNKNDDDSAIPIVPITPVVPFTPNATVLNQGFGCGNSYLIKFNNNANGVPVNSTENVFNEINLPNQFKVNNLPIFVTFRLPTNDEFMNCSTQGITYPQIYIETATNQ